VLQEGPERRAALHVGQGGAVGRADQRHAGRHRVQGGLRVFGVADFVGDHHVGAHRPHQHRQGKPLGAAVDHVRPGPEVVLGHAPEGARQLPPLVGDADPLGLEPVLGRAAAQRPDEIAKERRLARPGRRDHQGRPDPAVRADQSAEDGPRHPGQVPVQPDVEAGDMAKPRHPAPFRPGLPAQPYPVASGKRDVPFLHGVLQGIYG